MANTNYGLIANDIHGVKEREDAFFQAVMTYRGQLDHIILNGDIFGGERMSNLQKLFYDVKNPLKSGAGQPLVYQQACDHYDLLGAELRRIVRDLGENIQPINKIALKDIDNCRHYGVFLSWVCFLVPALRCFFEAEITHGAANFFVRLNDELKTKDCVVILNTGNWEEATPLDFDPTDLSIEVKVAYDQRVSRQLAKTCEMHGVTFNEGYLHINRTGIVGANAILDAGKNGVGFGIRANQMICHFPNEYECFPEHKPSEKDLLCRDGVQRWLRGLEATYLFHGHVHSEGCQDHNSSLTSGPATNYVYARKVGLGGYALVQL